MKTTTISNLTPLRGVAAMLVAIFHYESVIAASTLLHSNAFIDKLYLMVDLFFVMSGFIMLHVYGKTFEHTTNRHDMLRFVGARFARIYPLHFITLLLNVAIFYLLKQPASPVNNPNAIITNLLLLHACGIHEVFTWNVPSWSISAEWWAYMLFPFLGLFLSKYKNSAIITLSILAIVAYFSICFYLPRVNPFNPAIPVPHNLDVTYDYGYIRGIAGFIAGMLVYLAYQQDAIRSFFDNDWWSVFALILSGLLMYFGAHDILIVLSFMPLVLMIAANQKKLYQLFLWKPLQYIGDISYSIYMVHGINMFMVAIPLLSGLGYIYKGPGSLHIPITTWLWTCGLYLISVIALSSLSYHFIEKPCRRWLNKKFNRA